MYGPGGIKAVAAYWRAARSHLLISPIRDVSREMSCIGAQMLYTAFRALYTQQSARKLLANPRAGCSLPWAESGVSRETALPVPHRILEAMHY